MGKPGRTRTALRMLLAVAFLVDGILHWTACDVFAAIVPDWVPAPGLVVLATGIAAFAGGLGLLIGPLQREAGAALALYCLCVFPANVHHAFRHIEINGVALGWGYHGPRLILQPLLIWACLWTGGATDWPFRTNAEPSVDSAGRD